MAATTALARHLRYGLAGCQFLSAAVANFVGNLAADLAGNYCPDAALGRGAQSLVYVLASVQPLGALAAGDAGYLAAD